jgi:hypothetical protein
MNCFRQKELLELNQTLEIGELTALHPPPCNIAEHLLTSTAALYTTEPLNWHI